MKTKFRQLRMKQLSEQSEPFLPARGVARPSRGWLAAVREVSGLSLRAVAAKLETSFQVLAALEKSEAADRITLRKLRQVADALGCELVYALVPKTGSMKDLAEAGLRPEAEKNVRAVEHTMALENQAVGGVEEKVKEEIRSRLESEQS